LSKPEFSLSKELAAISEAERTAAKKRQAQAGIVPVRTSFRADLDSELDGALDRIWKAGCSSSDGVCGVDRTLRLLYQQIGRGLSCLTEADLITFSKLPLNEMRALSRWLIQGRMLAEASWLARKKQPKKPQKETAQK
jgi:hypothetical protein